MQDRIELFKGMGFECVGGEIAPGIYDSSVLDLPEADLYIWVDFKGERTFLDCGDSSEPFFLKGDFTKKELEEYTEYENDTEQEMNDANDSGS
jgi:hypothetical protein